MVYSQANGDCEWGRHKTDVVARNRNALVFGGNMGGVANPITVPFTGAVNVSMV